MASADLFALFAPFGNSSNHGLHLGGKIIKRLSGPVSFFYLKPSEEAWNRFHEQGVDLPLLILMGDIHFSEYGRCQDCRVDHPHYPCYAIEDKAFLRLLDGLAEHTPIDFFTESSEEETTPEKLTRVGIHQRLMETTQFAHRVPLRAQPPAEEQKQDAYLPVTRWHHANVRTMSRWVESALIEPFSLYLQQTSHALSGQADSPSPAPVPEEIRYATYDLLLHFLDPQTDSVEETTEALLTDLFHALSGPFAEQSGVFKQYRKSALSTLIPFDALIPLLAADLLQDNTFRGILTFFKESHEKGIREFTIFSTWCERLLLSPDRAYVPPSTMNKKLYQHYVDYTSQILTIVEHHLMDLYFLFRMLKEPKGSTTATLSLAYMGDAHIKSLLRLFTHPLFGYTISYENRGISDFAIQSPHYAQRCIEINRPIDLEKEVMEHHAKRFGDRPNALQRYRNVIQREKQGRAPPAPPAPPRSFSHTRNRRNNNRKNNNRKNNNNNNRTNNNKRSNNQTQRPSRSSSPVPTVNRNRTHRNPTNAKINT